ncbi:MAG: hypothetical protein LBS36_06965 [Oscillospiraceae bacterium]|jgi:hypothetical protein|nr:hypothetical protein [Oscillospiraceae bacterium]
MKELANKIKIIPVQYIASDTEDTITPVNPKYLMEFFTGDDKFQQKGDMENGNPYTEQSDEREVTAIMPEQITLLHGSRVVVLLETTKGIHRIWGSKEYPVQCKVDAFSNGVKLKLYRKALRPLLF